MANLSIRNDLRIRNCMNEFISAINQICEEKGISKEKVIETVEMAIAAAYKKDYGLKGLSVRADYNEESGGFDIFQAKLVLDPSMVWSEEELAEMAQRGEEEDEARELELEPAAGRKIKFNEEKHIFLEDSQKLNLVFKEDGVRKFEDKEEKFNIFLASEKSEKKKKGKKEQVALGDEIWFALAGKENYGRIAAQTAKQVVIQRIREAEREAIFDEFKNKEGEVISATVQRIEKGIVFVDIGKGNGVMFPEDQIPGEYYRIGQRLRVFVAEVKKDVKGPGIIVSRTRPEMIVELFSLEVPEISTGSVEIKSVAREAGSRSKIAVVSTEEGVDAIGACVGQRGTRVQAIINELGGEKVDIIEWSENPAKFIANSLSPAKVINVEIKEKERMALVQVPEDQLSLAIGKQGQNVRLAAKLTGWKIDILTETGEQTKPDVEETVGTEDEKTSVAEAEEVKKGKKTKPKKTKKKEQKEAEPAKESTEEIEEK